jgi:hypothetical protein
MATRWRAEILPEVWLIAVQELLQSRGVISVMEDRCFVFSAAFQNTMSRQGPRCYAVTEGWKEDADVHLNERCVYLNLYNCTCAAVSGGYEALELTNRR